MSIVRVWQGRTTADLADRYEQLLREIHFPRIAARRIPGFQRIELHRRALADGVEFMTVMWFDTLAAVQAYAGPDIERAAIAPEAGPLLTDPDDTVRHFALAASAERTP